MLLKGEENCSFKAVVCLSRCLFNIGTTITEMFIFEMLTKSDLKVVNCLILFMLNPDTCISPLENSVDPDQLASEKIYYLSKLNSP